MSDLIEAARAARQNAYAPYSGYKVGAALRTKGGRVFTGCNFENIAYPVGTCAERVAIGAMVAAGDREIIEVSVATQDGGTPCGMCLQALFEFTPSPEAVQVVLTSDNGDQNTYTLSELLPHGFRSAAVSRTEREPQ